MNQLARTGITAGLLGLAACGGGGGGPGQGTLILEATDTPFVHDIVTQAEIRVDRISIASASDASSGFLTLYDGAPILLDLLNLRDGLTQELVQSSIPAGTYRQVRLHVTKADLSLVDGDHFSSDDGTLHLTSQDTSGYKVFVDPPIVVQSGLSMRFVLDFDLTKTFHPIPSDDPLAANAYSLHPLIHAANVSTTGEIRGLVTRSDGNGGFLPVADATVYVLPAGDPDVDHALATTATGATGAYAQLGIAPGTYDVKAVKGAQDGVVAGVSVVAGSIATADVVID